MKAADLIRRHRSKEAASIPTPEAANGDAYVSVGLGGIMAATGKLLAVNRGLEPPDDRDAWEFKRLMTPDKLFRERIRLDASKMRRQLIRRAAKRRTLQGVMLPFAFDEDVTGLLVSNPLSSPLEEINPMHLVEQSRRITMMGPGGIGTDQAITPSMQQISASQFGFISGLEGPECFDDQTEVYTSRGWKKWADVKDDETFACRIEGRLEWHKAERIVRESYKGDMIVGENESIRMCVTPGHRVAFHPKMSKPMQLATAAEVHGRSVKIPIRHEPEIGDEGVKTFQLPDLEKTNNNQRAYGAFDIVDWSEFVGWWLAEGSSCEAFSASKGHMERSLKISQCVMANPVKHERIRKLLVRLGLIGEGTGKSGRSREFVISAKQLFEYFRRWNQGCYDKWIPEEMFTFPVAARQKLLEGLLLGDGRWNKKRISYCTVSYALACSVERLAIGLGYPAFIRIEKDTRPHVKTTNYIVSISRALSRQLHAGVYKHPSGKDYGGYWSVVPYDGMVYCATVPGSLLLVRGTPGTAGFWSGNSGRAGVDVRMAWGTKIGSDGKIYQRFKDRRTGNMTWLSPEDLAGRVVGIPD